METTIVLWLSELIYQVVEAAWAPSSTITLVRITTKNSSKLEVTTKARPTRFSPNEYSTSRVSMVSDVILMVSGVTNL